MSNLFLQFRGKANDKNNKCNSRYFIYTSLKIYNEFYIFIELDSLTTWIDS